MLPIETERLRLRHFAPPDLEAFLAYRNDPDVARYQGWDPTSRAEGEQFITEMSQLEPGVPDRWFQFALALKSNDALIGDVGFRVGEGQGMVGYTLARAYQHHGYMTEALGVVLKMAFEDMDLHRVIALVDPRNDPSWKLLERLGFRREGHFIEHWMNKGHWVDDYQYALLQREWKK